MDNRNTTYFDQDGEEALRPIHTYSGNRRWIKQLVRNEVNLSHTGTGDLVGHQDHKKVVGEATVELLISLKEEFTSCVDMFNSYRGDKDMFNSIKIFHVSKTAADFILFRNNLKFLTSNENLGVINFSFISRMGLLPQQTDTENKTNSSKESYDIIAQIYPFNELAWTFHGERINMEALVRYMFVEFVKTSAVY